MLVDFNLPKRFNITYVGADGKEHEIVMIHRALLGAIERFFAILIEHYNGNLPAWLAPTQVAVLPVSTVFMRYAEEVHRKLLAQGVRSELDSSTSTISYRIRQAETRKIPYMAICGKHETELKKIAGRKHGLGKIGLLTVQELVHNIKQEDKP